MAQLVVRDVDEEVAAALKARAAANGRSTEAEHRQLLRDVLAPRKQQMKDFAEAAQRLRARLSHNGDSAAIIRDSRDQRLP